MQNRDINHTLESMFALVATSLLLKGIERCSERCCPTSEIQQVVQEVEAQAEEAENDITKEFDDDGRIFMGDDNEYNGKIWRL